MEHGGEIRIPGGDDAHAPAEHSAVIVASGDNGGGAGGAGLNDADDVADGGRASGPEQLRGTTDGVNAVGSEQLCRSANGDDAPVGGGAGGRRQRHHAGPKVSEVEQDRDIQPLSGGQRD